MKPNRKYAHLYAVVRYATEADELTPIDMRFSIIKVVADPHYANQEAARLGGLNEGKGYHYFVQIARFEDVPIVAQPVPPINLPLPEAEQVKPEEQG